MYVIDAVFRAGFSSLANIFIIQLHNFTCVQKDGFFVICLIIYKLKLKSG